mmetsp:Transcript_50593/g.81785  ORF Transcript_50593/g.81785 Transcript_50593/m.81785 type:complete len:437 (+) Transcript_50593:3-1313(+)
MEFQAVVLADHDDGSGTRLYPLLESTPKGLLSVAGRPLIAYQLALLERSGFKEAIVVTTEKAREALHNFAESRAGKEGCTSIAIEIVALDEELDTAEVLRAIKHKIRKDFVVISGDLVTDVYVHHLADVHRIHDSTCTVLLRGPKEVNLKPGEKKPKNEGAIPDFVGLDESKTRLLCLQSASDVEDALILPRAMLRSQPNMTITNKMLDAHFYIFSRWVLDLLDAKKEMTSIKCELVPYLIENQFSATPVPGQPLRQEEEDDDDEDDVKQSETPAAVQPLRVSALVYESGYCSRADSMHAFKEMNFELPRHKGSAVPWSDRSSFSDKSEDEKKLLFKKVGSECMVGEGFSCGDKSSIKKSVVGKHCSIGAMVKLVSCIVLDHVTIKDECQLTGCVIGNNVHIDKLCTVTNCQIGDKYQMEEESEHKNETLVLDDDE